jgi:hypothetical protein
MASTNAQTGIAPVEQVQQALAAETRAWSQVFDACFQRPRPLRPIHTENMTSSTT